jgi:hypothetical protein
MHVYAPPYVVDLKIAGYCRGMFVGSKIKSISCSLRFLLL